MDLPASERQRIARRAFSLVAAIVALGVAPTAALLVLGQTRVALGLLGGHLLALATGLSWIVGAVRTFDAPFDRFARATLGLSPFRLVVVVGGIAAAVLLGKSLFEPVALVLSFVATQLLLHVAQADCFMQLSDATSPYAAGKTPTRLGGLRFGGLRFWR